MHSPICRGLRPKNRPVGSSDVSSDQRYLAVATLAQGSLEGGSLQVLVLAASTDARLALLNFDAQQRRCAHAGPVPTALIIWAILDSAPAHCSVDRAHRRHPGATSMSGTCCCLQSRFAGLPEQTASPPDRRT